MEENEQGLAHVTAGNTHAECARCGAPARRHTEVLADPHGREFQNLCDRCYREVLLGDAAPELLEEE